ncbi:ABC transporter permease [Carnimonas nigrificans]|uniref:ABC transporter permease n=1 Tax=Carnimonas nigrificans TaxID=64323 RepID=UPI00046F970C|nr:ABC transporter permease [Carnimonas nigrificans]
MSDSSDCPDSRSSTSLRLGLIPAPELPEKIILRCVDELGELLHWHVDEGADWQIDIVVDPLVGGEGSASEVMERAAAIREREQWDYVVCITDLPLFRDGYIAVAEASDQRGVAVISQPTLGISPLRKRMREAILHLVSEMHWGGSHEERAQQQQRMDERKPQRQQHGLRNRDAHSLLGLRFAELLVSFRRVTCPQDNADVDVRFLFTSTWRGYIRLLGGMVRANRPWSMMPAFRHIFAVAFGTGAYGLIFTTLWILSSEYSIARFVVLMLAAIGSMVAWLIIDHGLWEPQQYTHGKAVTRLYNAATVVTLGIGVCVYFIVLYLLFLTAVVVFVPTGFMAETLHQPVGLSNFMLLAWLATSVATFAGALGAGLESEEVVRNATYGYRQRQRNNKVEKLQERQEKKEQQEQQESQKKE